MNRTATSEQVAAALHVQPATVRKYARDQRLPFDTTPGGHRRFDVDEAVHAILGDTDAEHPTAGEHPEEHDLPEPVPFVRVAPGSRVAAVTVVTRVLTPGADVHDTPQDVEDWAAETTVV